MLSACVASYSAWQGNADNGGGDNVNNELPKAQLGVYPDNGPAPLQVQHDGTGSWDVDGTIASYDWDFDGDGTFDLIGGAALPAEYTYAASGEYTARLRVTDNDGGISTATALVTVTGSAASQQEPQAQVAASSALGEAPMAVSFDASASSDVDGTITRYDWDFDGDGTFDLLDGGPQPEAHQYHEPGHYRPTVRITDDDGLTNTATIDVIVSSGELPDPENLPEMQVATWQGNATAALSLTFDDGTPEHWTRGLALWQEYGFRVTLGIIARTFQQAPERLPQLQIAFNAGHELANHTSTHPDLTTLTEMDCCNELTTCQQLLLNNVQGLDRIYTVIYPYEEYNDTVIDRLTEMGYMFARSGAQSISDYAEINDAWDPPRMHLYSWANQRELPMWMWDSIIDAVVADGGWQIEQCHGIGDLDEPGVGWSPRPETEYRAHYDHIASYGDQLWVAPVGEVGRYILERNVAEFVVLDYTDTELTFILTDTLDNNIFDVPLTVIITLPTGWTAVSARQGVNELTVTTPESGLAQFDVAPGGGIVTLTTD
ncbi:polysaccharide deacetylase family protein [bacterium]|nr:polysaccharide deacetylase family protein [bacterium]